MYRRVSHLFFPAPILWVVMLVLMVITVLWAHFSNFEIVLGVDPAIFYILGACVILGLVYHKRSPFLAIFGFTLSLFLLMSLVLRPLSYLGAAEGFPLVDAQLAWLDTALGFDWLAHVAWVNNNWFAMQILDLAYSSIMVQFVFIFFLFYLSQNYERARELLLVFFWMGIATTFVSMFTPAAGAFDYYKPGAELINNLKPSAGRYFQEHFLALHDGGMRSMTVTKSVGLIAFPSFHTQAAVLYMWATRRTVFFWPSVVLNLCMILSTLTFGGHFLGDLIAGVVVTVAVAYLYGIWAGRYRLSFARLRNKTIADQSGLVQAPIISKMKQLLKRARSTSLFQT